MRTLFVLTILASAQIGAAWAVGEIGIARPGGAFSLAEAPNARACERRCLADSLCMAWSFSDRLCELKAVVPAPIAQPGTISGVSPRAPASFRMSPQGPFDAAPLRARTSIDGAGPPILTEDDISVQLLGGPEPDGAQRLGQ